MLENIDANREIVLAVDPATPPADVEFIGSQGQFRASHG